MHHRKNNYIYAAQKHTETKQYVFITSSSLIKPCFGNFENWVHFYASKVNLIRIFD